MRVCLGQQIEAVVFSIEKTTSLLQRIEKCIEKKNSTSEHFNSLLAWIPRRKRGYWENWKGLLLLLLLSTQTFLSMREQNTTLPGPTLSPRTGTSLRILNQ